MEVYLVLLKCYLLDKQYPQLFVQGVYEDERDAEEYKNTFNFEALPIDTNKPYKLEVKPYSIIEHKINTKRK